GGRNFRHTAWEKGKGQGRARQQAGEVPLPEPRASASGICSAPLRSRLGYRATGREKKRGEERHTMAADRHQIETFLYREARLMDEHAYDEWLALWTDDALYWVPCNRDDSDPMREVSIIYDNRARLEDRIMRLKSGAIYAQEPKSRLRRVVANVEVLRNYNVEYIFSSPGSEWPPVWEHLAKQKALDQKGPQYLNTRHENLAIGMAMGYTKVTGRLPVVLLHTTVGTLQGAMALRAAYHEQVPMLVCAGE